MGFVLIRLCFWLLLTADISPANICIGSAAAVLIPKVPGKPISGKIFTAVLFQCLRAVPVAYLQAADMVIRRHRFEHIQTHPVRFGFNPLVVFMEIFLVTFTPKTLVLDFDEHGHITVHHIHPKEKE
ncbi:Na+/H+ antiporter subunit E [Desulfobacter latus]|uniref:Na+/H+ antiporter subunit E n=1 Tax=Desulfobacter latus TaxID=2292 RepID=A0A850T9K2_9BACT|nr:Na+/H+ antiporter subunit E [Desulfobacter latus]NWH06242.1 Na+/H+ antiporter subunit E [Desulfobacter latus]